MIRRSKTEYEIPLAPEQLHEPDYLPALESGPQHRPTEPPATDRPPTSDHCTRAGGAAAPSNDPSPEHAGPSPLAETSPPTEPPAAERPAVGAWLGRRGHDCTRAELAELLGSPLRALGWSTGFYAVWRRWNKAGPVFHLELDAADVAAFAELAGAGELTLGFASLGRGERLQAVSWLALPESARELVAPLAELETAAAMHHMRAGEVGGRALLVFATPQLSTRRAILMRARVAALARAAAAAGVTIETLEILDDQGEPWSIAPIVYEGDPVVAKLLEFPHVWWKSITAGELASVLPPQWSLWPDDAAAVEIVPGTERIGVRGVERHCVVDQLVYAVELTRGDEAACDGAEAGLAEIVRAEGALGIACWASRGGDL